MAARRRGAGPALRLLGEARRVAGFEQLALEPLDDDASLALLAGVDEPVRERILGESRGNPLYLTEFARRPDALSCPLLASIEVELDALSEGARALADGAAVAGDPFDPDLAAAAAGLELDPGALDELVAVDLVRPMCGPTFTFRHPMVCRAVYHPPLRPGGSPRTSAPRRRWSAAARAWRCGRITSRASRGRATRRRSRCWSRRPARRTGTRWRCAWCPSAPRRLLGPYGLALARAGRLVEAREALAARARARDRRRASRAAAR